MVLAEYARHYNEHEAAHRAAQATADMIIDAARSVPGARLSRMPVTHIPAAITTSGYCQM